MITTLLFDFANVLLLPGGLGEPAYVLNAPLIEFVKSRHQMYPAHIFSNLSPVVLEESRPQIVPPFVSILAAKNLQLSKTDPASYQIVAQMINAKPEGILFIDDQQWNIDAASRAGMQTILFESTELFIRKASALLV